MAMARTIERRNLMFNFNMHKNYLLLAVQQGSLMQAYQYQSLSMQNFTEQTQRRIQHKKLSLIIGCKSENIKPKHCPQFSWVDIIKSSYLRSLPPPPPAGAGDLIYNISFSRFVPAARLLASHGPACSAVIMLAGFCEAEQIRLHNIDNDTYIICVWRQATSTKPSSIMS